MQITYILFAIFFIWGLILSYFVFKIFHFFSILSKGLEQRKLIDIITKVLDIEKDNKKKIQEIEVIFKDFEHKSNSYIQKIGLVRFNPFTEMGGDQSFSLSLLNFQNSGVIITGLHMRDRTRMYVKRIDNGKSEIELSKEEEKSLKLAQGKK
ncbi:hypothetical protein A2159_03200 [Candidatus Woesebacteria bacterium RBG_13_34_9]|uniref:DUF4446 domain-containing protein n=1 Tax=Candidatus Woesebacteria bacterium RBG_13_34_9 TaxID=1802477 RepID=A0A1F7X6F9_9BACT|nr:MAG: hypothetical protein A2159_03200 [Candidatus Woesebacteria bacterium RBG_13_34_9]